MGDNEPESRVSVCGSGSQHGGQGGGQRLVRKDLQSQVGSRAGPPAADAKGDQRGVGWPSGVCGSAVSAVLWSLPQLSLESGGLDTSGSFDKCLARGAFSQKPVGGPAPQTRPPWPVCGHRRCVSWPDVSALTQAVPFLNRSIVADWPPSWLTGLHFVLQTSCRLDRTDDVLWVLLPTPTHWVGVRTEVSLALEVDLESSSTRGDSLWPPTPRTRLSMGWTFLVSPIAVSGFSCSNLVHHSRILDADIIS